VNIFVNFRTRHKCFKHAIENDFKISKTRKWCEDFKHISVNFCIQNLIQEVHK